MKKLVMINLFLALLATSCKKQVDVQPAQEAQQQDAQQQPLVCGMEEAMASLSAEMRGAMRKNSETVSNAGATGLLLFLDFDGAFVRRGFPNSTGYSSSIIQRSSANCPAPSLTQTQKDQVIELVKDDFSPFNILVSTDEALFNTYSPAFNKEICIITTLPSVIGFPFSTAGVAPWGGLGSRSPADPSFAFAQLFGNDLAMIASTISHEVGHTLGLGHQSLYNTGCGLLNEYHPGFGSGPLSFEPIMGFGNQRISNWFAQTCSHPIYGGPQNDFELLNNQVELKEDDYPGNMSGNSTVTGTDITGILEQQGDIDFIRINFKKPGPVTITSENIDLKVSLYNPGGQLLGEYNDPNDTRVTIPSANGMRYLKIEAASNANMSAQFMTGQYKITY